jgi:hypothetical protein
VVPVQQLVEDGLVDERRHADADQDSRPAAALAPGQRIGRPPVTAIRAPEM